MDWGNDLAIDKEAFAQAVQKVKNDAYRIAFCYMNNEEDSMNCVCNAIEKAFINIGKLREPRFFKTWFIRLTINECKMMLRRKKKFLQLGEKEPTCNDNEDVSLAEVLDLKNLILKMPRQDKTLIYMKFYLGYTLSEIAEIMSIPEGTVKTRLYSNLKKLRDEIVSKEV